MKSPKAQVPPDSMPDGPSGARVDDDWGWFGNNLAPTISYFQKPFNFLANPQKVIQPPLSSQQISPIFTG